MDSCKLKQQHLDKIQFLLGKLGPGSSDEQKLSSLFLLSKCVDATDSEQVDILFKGLNFKFLDRLLKQGNYFPLKKTYFLYKKKSQELKGVCVCLSYCAFVLNIKMPLGMKRPKMDNGADDTLPVTTMVSVAVNILSPFFQKNEISDILLARLPLLINNLDCQDAEITQTILECCIFSAQIARGANALADFLPRVIDFGFKIQEASLKELSMNVVEMVGITLLTKTNRSINKEMSLALASLAPPLVSDHFRILKVLKHWLEVATIAQLPPGEDIPGQVWEATQRGLNELLKTPSHSQPHKEALALSSLLTRHYGFGWLVQDTRHLPGLLLRLAATETRVGLEEIQLVKSDQTTDETLLAGFEFLTLTVRFLSAQEGSHRNFALPHLTQLGLDDPETMTQILIWLRETFRDSLHFVSDWVDEAPSHPLLLIILQGLCIYLAEDPELLLENNDLTSNLLKYLSWCFDMSDSLPLISDLDLLSFHGTRLILQACETSPKTVIPYSTSFGNNLLKKLFSDLESTPVLSSKFNELLPSLLPCLRALNALCNIGFSSKETIKFQAIYSAAQAALDDPELL